jgi:UDP-glucuronate 4-epimerase
MAHSYSYLYKLPTTGLRFFTVYGPWGRPDMALFKFTKCILDEKPIDVFNNGKHTRDFTYIDDIVDGVINTLDNPASINSDWNSDQPDPSSSKAPWRVYNIGNNKPVQLMDYISSLEKALGKKAKINFLPLQPGDVPDTFANVSNLVKEFNYKPSTTINEGISNFVKWYKDYYQI